MAAVGPGSLVRSLATWPIRVEVPRCPVEGHVYTVRAILSPRDYARHGGYYLVEMVNPKVLTADGGISEVGFDADYFVPVDDGQLDWARDLTRELEDA